MIFSKRVTMLISLLLASSMIILAPFSAYAGGIRLEDALCGLVLVATGAYLVYAGASAVAAAGGAVTWGVGLGSAAGSGTAIVGGAYLVLEGKKFLTGESKLDSGGSGNSQYPPQNDAYEICLSSNPNSLPLDGVSQSTISIQLKNSLGEVLDALPSEFSLWVKQSNSNANLVEGNYMASLQGSSVATEDLIGFQPSSSLVMPGRASIIEYSLKGKSPAVLMEIANNSGNVVYSIAESTPNPAKPIPFVWGGRSKTGENLSAGAYTVRLKALDNSGQPAASTTKVMYIGSSIGTDERQITFSSGIAYLTLTAPLNGASLSDVLTVTLKDKDGKGLQTRNITINFYQPGGSPPTVSPTTLPTEIKGTVDGNLVTLKQLNNGIETIVIDGSNNRKYHFIEGASTFSIEESNGIIKRPGIFDEDANLNEQEITEGEYKTAAERVIYLLEELAKGQGINFNGLDIPTVNSLSDGTTFTITSDSDGDTVVSVSSPGESPVQLVADYAAWTLSSPFDVSWASALDLDNPSYAVAPSTGKISIASVGGSNKAEITRKVLVLALVRKGKKEFMQTKEIAEKPTPNVTSISWPIDTEFPRLLNVGFGPRFINFSKGGDFHMGLDLDANSYKNVRAMFDGKIVRLGWEKANDHNWGFGYRIAIQSLYNGKNCVVYYGHLVAGSEKVKNGSTVYSGQSIAEADSTGNSTGHHLHFEIRSASDVNVRENPLKYLDYDPSNIKPSILAVVGPLLNDETPIALGGDTAGNIKFKATIKTTEKDLDKVRMRLIKQNNQTIFDNTFDYHIMATMEAASKVKTRFNVTTKTFKWDTNGTMLQIPFNALGKEYCADEFICTWSDGNKDGEYKLLLEAIDVKGNKSDNYNTPLVFSVYNGKLQ